MAALRLVLLTVLAVAAAGCTPGHTLATGQSVAARVGLQDGFRVERSTDRLLSRHSQVCLASDARTESRDLLEAMQRGFSGHFLAVGIDAVPGDYGAVLHNPSCPGAHYVFYADIVELRCDGRRAEDGSCGHRSPGEVVITVISREDRTLADRIRVSFTRGLLSRSGEGRRLEQAFDQLASALTGAGGG